MDRFPSTSTDYEKIVKDIYQDLLQKEKVNTEVRHNFNDIRCKSDTYPQINIYWCFKVAGIEHKVIIDYKNITRKYP